MPIESNLAGLVRVSYEAVTGEFNRDVDVAARNYVQGNEQMSDAAVRLSLAQDKLRREIAKGPGAQRAQARALLEVRRAERDVEAQTRRTTTALEQQNRTGTRSRAVFASLRSGVALATGGLLGATGLVYALRSVTGAAKEAETSAGRVRVAVRNAGIDYDRWSGQIDRVIQRQSRLAAIDDEELADSFAKLVIRTRDVNEALRLNALAADIARGRNISLENATQLVIKASLNQAGQLRRVGLEVGKNTTAEQLLAKLRQAYAGQAVQYATSAAGAQDRLNVSYENSREIIGQGLTPALADLSQRAARWLEQQNESGNLQRNVNQAVKVGTSVVKGLAEGLRIVKSVAEPVVDALGGIEKAAELALIVGIVRKVRRAAAGFGPLQLASRTTATRGVADAATFGRAWDVATRPRTMSVTTVPTGPGGTVVGPGRQYPQPIGPPTKPGRFPKIPYVFGFNAPTIVAAAVVSAAGASGARTGAYSASRYPRVAKLLAKVQRGGRLTENERSAISILGQRSISEASPAELAQIEANLVPQVTGVLGGDRDRPNMGAPIPRGTNSTSSTSSSSTTSTRPRRTMVDIATDLSRALTTPGTGDEAALYREQIGRYRKQIGVLEARKTLTNTQKQTLQRLYGDLGAAQSSLQGLEDAAEQEQDRRDDAADRRRKARVAARKRKQEARTRQAVEDAKSLSAGARKQIEARFPMGEKRLGRIDPADLKPKSPTSKDDAETVTRDELAGIFRDFLTGFGDLVSTYYGNVAGGSLSTSYLEHLTREQTDVIRQATKSRTYSRPVDDAIFA